MPAQLNSDHRTSLKLNRDEALLLQRFYKDQKSQRSKSGTKFAANKENSRSKSPRNISVNKRTFNGKEL
jgi:hypothetical protein